MSNLVRVLATSALLSTACDTEEPDPTIGLRPCVHCTWGPPLLNSHGLNGIEVSALDTKGEMYDGWRLLEVLVRRDGSEPVHPVHDLFAEKGHIFGYDDWGAVLSGEDFVGSRWTVEVETTGSKEVLEVVSFLDDPDASRYTFVSTDNVHGVNSPKNYTCPLEPDTGEYSVVMFGDLDVDAQTGKHFAREHTLYFGCAAAAVGKSAVWGYAPWTTDEVTHQTASRTVRADYCGNGHSYTKAGTPLQLRDVFGINQFIDPDFDTEAFWGPDGAVCIKVPRYTNIQDIACAGNGVPYCEKNDTFDTQKEGLLWSKVMQ